MTSDDQNTAIPTRMWDVLVDIGFVPVTGRMAPCLCFDFGSFTVEAMQTINRHFADVVLLTGYVINKHVMAELIQEIPSHVESRRQGVAWLTWAIEQSLGDFLDDKRHPAPMWLKEGRQDRELLPWERQLKAYEQRPHCCVSRAWAKLAIRAIRDQLQNGGSASPLTFSFDGEALCVRCAGKFVGALPATGNPWPTAFLVDQVTPDRLQQRLARCVTVSVWENKLTMGRVTFGAAVPATTSPLSHDRLVPSPSYGPPPVPDSAEHPNSV